MYRNYTVSRSERLAFSSIGSASRRAARAAQPKPESFSIEQHRALSASEKFDYAVRQEMRNMPCDPMVAAASTSIATV
jgi:hypothetical protein